MSNNLFLINNLYLGPIELWMHLYKSDEIILECQEHYQKKSFRNKCEILCSSGVELLSIPLKKGKNGGLNIRNVEIAYDDNWPLQHLKKIHDAYTKAPYYEHYIEELKTIIENRYPYLYDLNYALLKWNLKVLNISNPIIETRSFQKEPIDPIIDLRPISVMKRNETFSSSIIYPQVYEYKFSFKPNLSILDLIMNQGPESIVYLKQLQQK